MSLKVLALVPSIRDTSPGQRFRLEQWEPILNSEGIVIDLQPFEDKELHAQVHKAGGSRRKVQLIMQAFRRRWQLVRRVRDYDVVYVFREAALLGPPWIEKAICRKGVPMVFDFDDAIFVPYKSPTNSYLSLLKFAGKTKQLCQISSHVLAGNPYLAEYAGAVNKNVSVVPTTIDTDKYLPVDLARGRQKPVIGWSGSFSTVQHLDTLRETLPKLAKLVSYKLRVIGTPDYQLPGVETQALPWRSDTELADLGEMDAGLMPLPDDTWSKGKCGLKALQYMALGIPAVCSPVGVNTEIVQDGENGCIAGTEEEWIDRLTRLIRTEETRVELGRAGRQTVVDKYSARVQAPRVATIFKSVCPSRVPAKGALEMEAAK